MSALEPTAKEIFAAMEKVAQDPAIQRKFNASAVFVLEDDKFRVDATAGESKEEPDLVVTSTLQVFHDLLNKKLTPQQAFLKGKLKIRGNMGLAMKLTVVMNATRKNLQRSANSPRSKL